MEINDFGKAKVSIDFKVMATAADAKVSVFDRSFLFGDSIYEAVRTYEGRLFTFAQHMARLQRSAEAIYLKLPFTALQLEEHLKTLIKLLNTPDCFIRIVVSRGISDLSIEPPAQEQPLTVVIAKPLKPWPEKSYQQGIRLVTPQVRRNPKAALDPNIKSGNYLNSVLASYQAHHKGADDAAILGTEGQLTETPNANIFLVKNSVLCSPPLEDGLLDGITREVIIRVAKEHQIPVSLSRLTMNDVAAAQECFMASTTREVMPVASINDFKFDVPGPLTQKLRALYRDFVRAELAKE